jgi:hypothetical protein
MDHSTLLINLHHLKLSCFFLSRDQTHTLTQLPAAVMTYLHPPSWPFCLGKENWDKLMIFLTHFEHIDHCTLVSVKDALMSKQLAKHKTQCQIFAMRPLQKVEKLCDLSMLYLTNRLGCFMKPTLPAFTGDIHLLVIQGLTDGWLDPGLMGQEQGHV